MTITTTMRARVHVPASRRRERGSIGGPLLWVAVAVTSVLTVLPITTVVVLALGGETGDLLGRSAAVFQDRRTWEALGNTGAITAVSLLISLIVGTGLAWVYVKTDIPWKRAIAALCYVPMITAPLISAMAWQLLAAERSGIINSASRALGLGAIVDSGTIWGIAWTMGVMHSPFVFAFVSSALRRIPASLEESARAGGASPLRALSTVTIPLLAPALLASGITVAVLKAGDFAVPAILGAPNGIYTLSTLVYEKMHSFPADLQGASALGLVLVFMIVVLLGVQRALLKDRGYAAPSGKGLRIATYPLGRAKVPVVTLVALYFVVAVGLPNLALLWASLTPFWDGRLQVEMLTADTYVRLFGDASIWNTIGSTIILCVVSAAGGVALAFLLAYFVIFRKVRGGRWIELIATIPIAVPGIVFAIGVLYGWISLPIVLYGTFALLGIAYVGHFLPTAVQNLAAAFQQVGMEMEESSRVSGAGRLATFRHVLLPLTAPAAISSGALLFIMFVRELPASILLYSPGMETLSVRMFLLWIDGHFSMVAALSFAMILICLAGLLVMLRFEKTEWSDAA